MNLDQFVKKWTGKPCDFDHAYGNQCVDLIRQYCVDVLGIDGYTLPAVQGAKDLFQHFVSSNTFIKVDNTKLGVPPAGAIIVFKNSTWFPFLYGWTGHTGIVVSGDVKNVVYFSQNYPTGHMPQLLTSNYKDCLGWLIKK